MAPVLLIAIRLLVVAKEASSRVSLRYTARLSRLDRSSLAVIQMPATVAPFPLGRQRLPRSRKPPQIKARRYHPAPDLVSYRTVRLALSLVAQACCTQLL